MEDTLKKELAQNLWCALNCSTSNDKIVEFMELVQSAAKTQGLTKWQEYIDAKKDIRTSSLQRIKEILST